MTTAEVKKITETVLALPARKRAALAHSLLVSLPARRRSYDLDAVLAKRVQEVADGTAETVPAEEAMREIRTRLLRP